MADNAIQHALWHALKEILEARRLWIGYSGGVDSHVLLHALVTLRDHYPALDLRAVHIHHGLQTQADAWAQHCQKICQHLNVPCQIISVCVTEHTGSSLEALARMARYRALMPLTEAQDALLLAHHRDDQAETCLLQLLRGSGPRGLAAMPYCAPFTQGMLMRPFLNVSRDTILQYAQKHQLHWIEDESNHNLRFTRNFLRHRIIPDLQQRFPQLTQTISQVSAHCAEADQLLEELALEDLKHLQGSRIQTLSIQKLKQLSQKRQKNVLRFWVRQQGFSLPSTTHLKALIENVIFAKIAATPILRWEGVEIRRYQDDLYAMIPQTAQKDKTIKLTWNLKHDFSLPENLGTLTLRKSTGAGLRLPLTTTHIRFRGGGEKIRLKGRVGTHTLKKLFQEWHIPPWERYRIPLLYINDQLAAVVGYAIDRDFQTQPDEEGILIERCPHT